MSEINRIYTAGNPYQKDYKRVLCVCSAGILRSPTAAWVLSQDPYNFNTRSAGAVDDYALIRVDRALIAWADEIVFMEEHHQLMVSTKFDLNEKAIQVLRIGDEFAYRDPGLIQLIKERYVRGLLP